jgi:hypothetical protein
MLIWAGGYAGLCQGGWVGSSRWDLEGGGYSVNLLVDQDDLRLNGPVQYLETEV